MVRQTNPAHVGALLYITFLFPFVDCLGMLVGRGEHNVLVYFTWQCDGAVVEGLTANVVMVDDGACVGQRPVHVGHPSP